MTLILNNPVGVWSLLAWRPFMEPIQIDGFWMAMLIPLALAIAVAYKAIKLDDLSKLPRQALMLTGRIILFMALAAAALWLITELI